MGLKGGFGDLEGSGVERSWFAGLGFGGFRVLGVYRVLG